MQSLFNQNNKIINECWYQYIEKHFSLEMKKTFYQMQNEITEISENDHIENTVDP